jgi:putative oxidoreductase
MTLTFAGILFCCTGGGQISLDHAIGIFELGGMRWLDAGLALLAGFGGAAGLLVTFWRPAPPAAKD